MTEPATPRRARPAPAPSGHAASGARLLVGGLAAGAGLAMVGAMAAAAQAAEADAAESTQTIRRVVVVDQTPAEVVMVMSEAPPPEVITEVVRREIPAPAPRQAAEPQAESGGS